VRGTVTTLAFVPEVRDAIGLDMPLLAAGGMADGRSLAAALALGADGAVFGTRFVASQESAAHSAYKQRIVQAHASETVYTTLYDVGWPDAPHRVLRTKLIDEWERAGRPESGKRPGEGEQVGVMRRADVEFPLVRYSVAPPVTYVDGDPEAMALYAGQSCGVVNDLPPAAEIVRHIVNQAREIIQKRLGPLAF
jgi:nitronate monooxygenase